MLVNSSVYVRSIQTLVDFRSRLGRFSNDAQASIQIAEQEIRQVEEWLQQRLAFWQAEVPRRRAALRAAEIALAACLASKVLDLTGQIQTPDCGSYAAEVTRARQQLQQAEEELNNVKNWISKVNQAATMYRARVLNLKRIIQNEIPKANSLLGEKIDELQQYISGGSHSSGSISAPSTTNTASMSGDWIDTGIQSVELDKIDLEDSSVNSSDDFHKVSQQDMVEGLQKLQDVVAPAVANGADGDYFTQMDTNQGLSYADGYRKIYDAFFGNSCIRLDKIGNRFRVNNGYHRIFIAQQLGIRSLPARVIAQKP
jgi:CHASE3 domain sensor protein